ncbi:TRAP transporter substrate-binding protein [Microbaculum marinum]|uniref:TRAP transporter substrate-binding protein n=1 Tax=Microbaculum marinum TaxID=1764581 RepID=A0AAW9RZJ9_9HYPH
MKALSKIAAASVFAATTAIGAMSATAADTTLTISSWGPPTHGINSKMWPKFTEMVEQATDGRVTTDLKLNLAPPPAQFDMIQDGAADLSIIFHGYQPGRFTAQKLIELPGYEGSAEAASVADWRAYEKYLQQADEHRGVKLIALHTHGPAQVYTINPVESLDQINGLKLRVPGGVGSDVGTALGATGIQVPAPKVYETLASKAADGVVMPMESRKGFKLTEVAPYTYEMPGGFYRGSFAFIMNEDAFNSLPPDVQKALEENVFGEPLSRAIGQIWDEIDAEGRQATMDTAGNKIVEASDADKAAYKPIADEVTAKVIEEVAATGVDAQAAHDFIAETMRTYGN